MANPIKTKIDQGALVLDVRTAEEFEDEHYPNAINIPIGELQQRLADVGPMTRSVVLYCASGARSALGARVLKAAGYEDVVNAGGLIDMP